MARAKPVILIADGDKELLKNLREVLRQDYDVVVVRDGSRALEQSILRHPDVILFDRKCPLIGATQFLRIIRSNPRTEEIPVVVLSDSPAAANSIPGFLHGVLVKPLNIDELQAQVAAILRKAAAAKEVGDKAGAVQGQLEQISMVDLLQVFSINRRTGCLQLVNKDSQSTAEIFVHEGRLEEARAGKARGEKALFRLLAWQSGTFTFHPGKRAGSSSLSGSTDSLMMEGMRQADELARVMNELPAREARLERTLPVGGAPEGMHPITAEIFNLVGYYPRFSDLLDHAQATDLDVCLALRSLLQAGYLRVGKGLQGAEEQRDLLQGDEVFELQARLRRAGLSPIFLQHPKLAVVCANAAALSQFVRLVSHLDGFVPAELHLVEQMGTGSLGRIHLQGGASIDLYALGADGPHLPFSYLLSSGTSAALVWGTNELSSLEKTLRLLREDRKAAIVLAKLPGQQSVVPSKRQYVVDVLHIEQGALFDLLRFTVSEVMGKDDLRGATL